MYNFKSSINIIGINPFVFVPQKILQLIFKDAGKEKGHIPICGIINGAAYKQTLVRYSGEWRLYINTSMLKNSPKRIGEKIEVGICYDPEERIIPMHSLLKQSLLKNNEAKKAFDALPPSRQKEILRYIANLKTEESRQRNIDKAISHLLGKDSFAGRLRPHRF